MSIVRKKEVKSRSHNRERQILDAYVRDQCDQGGGQFLGTKGSLSDRNKINDSLRYNGDVDMTKQASRKRREVKRSTDRQRKQDRNNFEP